MKTNLLKSLTICIISLSLLSGCSGMMSKMGMDEKKSEPKENVKKCKDKNCKEKCSPNKKSESTKSNQ